MCMRDGFYAAQMLETRLSLRSLLTGAVTPLWQLVTQLLRFADAASHLPTAAADSDSAQSSSSSSPAVSNLYSRLYRTHMFEDLMRQVCLPTQSGELLFHH